MYDTTTAILDNVRKMYHTRHILFFLPGEFTSDMYNTTREQYSIAQGSDNTRLGYSMTALKHNNLVKVIRQEPRETHTPEGTVVMMRNIYTTNMEVWDEINRLLRESAILKVF